MAKELTITNDNDTLNISYRWWSKAYYFIIFFAVIWNAIILVFVATGAGWFISLHALVGLMLIWFLFTRLRNKTTISVNQRALSINHGPISWPFTKDKEIPAQSLVQLFVDKSNVRVNNQPTYNLVAKLDSGATVKLLRTETDMDKLRQLESAIEAHLGIINDESFDLSILKTGVSTMRLEDLEETLEKLEPILSYLPKGMKDKVDGFRQEARRRAAGSPEPELSKPARNLGDGWKADKEVTIEVPRYNGGAKPLPPPTHNFNFPLYFQSPGSLFLWNDEAFKVVRTAQIDFEDDNITTGIQMEVAPLAGGSARYLYCQYERERWSYFEERQLDELELNKLGFGMSVTDYPMRLDNGGDRYYPRDQQKGTRYSGGNEEEVRQFIYFSTASSTQFRGLEPIGRSWEVFVIDVVDSSSFEKPEG